MLPIKGRRCRTSGTPRLCLNGVTCLQDIWFAGDLKKLPKVGKGPSAAGPMPLVAAMSKSISALRDRGGGALIVQGKRIGRSVVPCEINFSRHGQLTAIAMVPTGRPPLNVAVPPKSYCGNARVSAQNHACRILGQMRACGSLSPTLADQFLFPRNRMRIAAFVSHAPMGADGNRLWSV